MGTDVLDANAGIFGIGLVQLCPAGGQFIPGGVGKVDGNDSSAAPPVDALDAMAATEDGGATATIVLLGGTISMVSNMSFSTSILNVL